MKLDQWSLGRENRLEWRFLHLCNIEIEVWITIDNINQGRIDHEDAEQWWDWKLQLKNCLNLIHKKVDFNLNKAIGSYSLGEQLWILWAAAMLEKPDLIIMD